MLIATKQHYYSAISTLYVQPDSKIMFIGKHCWMLNHAPKASDGDCFVSMEDVERLFSPDWAWTVQDGAIQICVPGIEVKGKEGEKQISICHCAEDNTTPADCREVEMKAPFCQFDGQLYLPLQSFFAAVTGAHCAQKDPFYMVSDTKTEIHPKEDWMHMYNMSQGSKQYGYFYETLWYEPAKRIVPYLVYLPSTYKKGTPQKLVVALHGANSDHHAVFDRSDGKLARLAEERGYVVLAVNGLFFRSFYGYWGPTSGGVNSNPKGSKENPLELTDLQLQQRKLGQECVFAQIRKVMEEYSVDEKRVYMMGNSMGGAGTIWLAGQHPEMFRAISPSGGNVSPDYFEMERIKNIPVLFIVGTEDEFGAFHQDEAAKRFVESGCDYQVYRVGGGNHSFGWTYALDKTFDFFDQH